MIKAIIFDADGVIVRPEIWFHVPAESNYGIPQKTFLEFIHNDFQRCTKGELELLDILPRLLEQWQISVSAKDFIRAWVEHEDQVDAGLLEQIQVLRVAGTPCYLATNQERNRAEYMKHEMGFQTMFDALFISSELRTRKPEAAFYEKVQFALGLEPSEILFFDDSKANVQGAKNLGWSGEVFTPMELPVFLKKYKIGQ
jgi:HAD superfamily hydrolase (TIGR01509 family)